jgi:hypothetical protein
MGCPRTCICRIFPEVQMRKLVMKNPEGRTKFSGPFLKKYFWLFSAQLKNVSKEKKRPWAWW